MRYKTMTNSEKALQMHETWNGKIETTAKSHVNSREDLAIAYTPGVAEPAKSPDPLALQKIQPPLPIVPSRLGQVIPPSSAIRYTFSPYRFFKS